MIPMIFFNIGWMVNYQGITENDQITGNFAHIEKNESGDEQYNFLPINGYLYGYVSIPGMDSEASNTIHLEKIGSAKDAQFLKGVTVIFFSRNPHTKVAYIVGWYKDATLYRYPQELPGRKIDKHQFLYSCKTKASNGLCIPMSQRTFQIPSAKSVKGGYGMSCIWYADKIEGFREKVLDYINTYKLHSHQIRKLTPYQPDIERRVKIEKNAIQAVMDYYESLNFNVVSVEKDNLGWDLTATHANGIEYFIEVKGLSGKDITAQLTPREYSTLKAKRGRYILAICTECLDAPVIHIFANFEYKDKMYGYDDYGNIIIFDESIAAIAKIK